MCAHCEQAKTTASSTAPDAINVALASVTVIDPPSVVSVFHATMIIADPAFRSIAHTI